MPPMNTKIHKQGDYETNLLLFYLLVFKSFKFKKIENLTFGIK